MLSRQMPSSLVSEGLPDLEEVIEVLLAALTPASRDRCPYSRVDDISGRSFFALPIGRGCDGSYVKCRDCDRLQPLVKKECAITID